MSSKPRKRSRRRRRLTASELAVYQVLEGHRKLRPSKPVSQAELYAQTYNRTPEPRDLANLRWIISRMRKKLLEETILTFPHQGYLLSRTVTVCPTCRSVLEPER